MPNRGIDMRAGGRGEGVLASESVGWRSRLTELPCSVLITTDYVKNI